MSDKPTKLGMAQNMAGLLCNAPCCIGLIFSIVAVIVEKENKFVRFHALQSLLLHGAGFAVGVALMIVQFVATMIFALFGFLVTFLQIGLAIALIGIQVFMMIKANNNEEFRLPVIGDMAPQWV